jgi:hypothetical protein
MARSTDRRNAASPYCAIRFGREDVGDCQLDAGRVERQRALAHNDRRLNRAAGSTPMPDDLFRCGIEEKIVGDARHLEIAGELVGAIALLGRG